MIKINSVSGGMTSAYIAANYPADYNVFALVRTNDKSCMYPDKKLRQIVSDKIGKEFIGTLEDDVIIRTIIELEQYIGQKIHWVSAITFDELINGGKSFGGQNILPSALRRFCTAELKLQPLFEWWLKNVNEPFEMRIGFRANEQSRAKKMLEKTNDDGFSVFKHVIGKHKNGNNKWATTAWQKPVFPLIDDNIYKDNVIAYWKGKPVKFAWMNNCVGCFHKNPLLLNKMSKLHPNKLAWFAKQEQGRKYKWDKWRSDADYIDIINRNLQTELFEDDFNDCDSGYCGF